MGAPAQIPHQSGYLRRPHIALTESNLDPLDLVKRDLIAGPVVEFGGPRAFVRGHGLRVLERAAGLKVGGDAGCAEHVAPELALQSGFRGAPASTLGPVSWVLLPAAISPLAR